VLAKENKGGKLNSAEKEEKEGMEKGRSNDYETEK
jgi:hypothetical protein